MREKMKKELLPADYPTYLPIIQKMTNSFVIFNNNNNQMKFRNA